MFFGKILLEYSYLLYVSQVNDILFKVCNKSQPANQVLARNINPGPF